MQIHVTLTQENVKSFPLHDHSVWEFICYKNGKGVLKTDDKDIPFSENTVVVMPPNIRHGSCSDKPFCNVCIHTDLSLMTRSPLALSNAPKRIVELFSLIAELYLEKRERVTATEALLVALKELILEELKAPAAQEELAFVRSEISKNFQRADFDLNGLISGTGYVEDHFRVMFKKQYGVTPKGWLDEIKMNAAKELLHIYGGALSVAEVAERCGYWDPLYFSRKFKKYFGVSPKQYIKRKDEK